MAEEEPPADDGSGETSVRVFIRIRPLNRKELVLPAILVGTLGNALGTYLGFLVVGIL